MRLISVNVGQERSIQYAKRSDVTGIYKLPVSEPVQVTPLGLTGDVVSDAKNHGGLDQALYVYGAADYSWWSTFLGSELSPGTFGENLTISELESAQIQIGDRLQVGAVTMEVTAPRIPCVTLATRMGDPEFVKKFRRAERPGLYCRVIEAGWVETGDPVRLERFTGETVSILEMFCDYYEPKLDVETLHRYLSAPIATRARLDKGKQLQELLKPDNV